MSGAAARQRKKLTFVDPATFTPHFSWEKSGSGSDAGESVRCESVSLSEIAEKAGTPTYVYSQAAIGDAYKELVAGFGSLSHTLCFAVKSNGNLAILKYLAGLGSGFDIVSGGELEHLQRIGVPGRRIVFSGVGKKREEMREALRYRPVGSRGSRGILLFNIESEAELAALLEESARERRRGAAVPAVSIRVNPDVQAGGHPHISTDATNINLGWIGSRRDGCMWRIAIRGIFNGGELACTSGRKSSRWVRSSGRCDV